jgi:hypothetical protein
MHLEPTYVPTGRLQRHHTRLHAAAAWLAAVLLMLHAGVRSGACADAVSCQMAQQSAASPPAPPCPCESPELCQPVRHRHEREVRVSVTARQHLGTCADMMRHVRRISSCRRTCEFMCMLRRSSASACDGRISMRIMTGISSPPSPGIQTPP